MIVGITGHRDLGSQETVQWVNQTLNRLIEDTNISLGITCLAKGSDQLFALALLRHRIPYIAIIASRDYEATFEDPGALENYKMLLNKASQVSILDNDLATDQAFYDAGKALVDKSDYIIAIWNGQAAKGLGGTADVVKYANQKGKRLAHINPILQSVSEINVVR